MPRIGRYLGLPALVTALAITAGAAPALAQHQPPPTSPYADGTGNSAVDKLNAQQDDRNPQNWHQVPLGTPGSRMMPPPPPPPGDMPPPPPGQMAPPPPPPGG